MSTSVHEPGTGPGSTPETEVITVVSRKTPILLTAFTVLLAVLVLARSHGGDTTYRLAAGSDLVTLPDVTLPSTPFTWAAVVVAGLLAVDSWRRYAARRSTPLWSAAAFALAAMFGFLTWAAAGASVSVATLLGGTVLLAVPLVFGAMCGVLGERVGVVNIAIDGQLLAGACAAAVVASATGSPWLGVAGAALAGVLVAALLGLFAVTYFVEQVIVGVVLNVLVIGLTSFVFGQVLSANEALNSPDRLTALPIPLLGDIPLLGPVLFRQSPLVYLLYVVVAVVTWSLYRTRWGLRLRAVGEHPKAADTVGIPVNRTRFRTLLIAGAIAGAGGAFYSLVAVAGFNREMTNGAGYIALAAVIFGKWDPIRATLAALLFGFASSLQGILSVIGSPVPSQIMLALPYVVTIFAVAGLVGRSRAPGAVGLPYRKG